MADERMKTLRDLLGKMGPQIKAALPQHVSQERFLRVMLTTIQYNPTLMDCTGMSIVGAMMEAAQLGLEIDGVHAALVPYRDHGRLCARLQVMYRGLIAMARRSGEVSTIRARAVYEGDIFEYEDGLDPKLRHIRGECEDKAKITHVYSIVEFRDGGKQFEVMTRNQVNAIRDATASYSRKPDDSPWSTDYDQMALKTVARRLLKWCPTAAEVQQAITHDELSERGMPTALATWDMPALPEGKPPTQAERAADIAAQVRARTEAQASAEAQPVPSDDEPPPPDAPTEAETGEQSAKPQPARRRRGRQQSDEQQSAFPDGPVPAGGEGGEVSGV